MKKIVSKIANALHVILMAPIKLPAKAMNILKYVAVGLGILEAALEEEESPPKATDQITNKEPTMSEQITTEDPKGQPIEIRSGKEEANEVE